MSNAPNKIMLVDDEPDVLEFLSYNLRREGYQVYSASNGQDAISLAREIFPHLIILDVMMPKMDGVNTCRELRKIPGLENTLIAFLTARTGEHSQLAGFDAGADDYISKPVRPDLFISRVKALLRRFSRNEDLSDIVQAGNIIIDRERYLVLKDDKEIILPKKEFELINLLASKPDKVFSREEIFSVVWGNNVVVGDRTIDVHVRKIREKIGIENIKTVKGVGYKFEI
jgi:two-component system, OmpR family, alkaline phosphatase synthesis response regulator PhoP